MARIIAIFGEKGSGKSTISQMVSDALPEVGVNRPALADPIKKGCQAMFGATFDQLWGPSDRRETQIGTLTFPDGKPITARFVLQTLGTEYGRNTLGENIWVQLMISYAASLGPLDVVAISDARFMNEAELLKKSGATLWRIAPRKKHSFLRRLANKLPFLYRIGDLFGLSPHQSEREMYYSSMDKHIDADILNDGTLDDLRTTVGQLLHFFHFTPDQEDSNERREEARSS